MKKVFLITFVSLLSFGAYAEGPILQCDVTREGPRSDGKPGYELIDKATISTVIDEKIETTQLKDLVVKTYVNTRNQYVLVLSDAILGTSSTQMGTLDNELINLSLSGKGYSNFIECEVL